MGYDDGAALDVLFEKLPALELILRRKEELEDVVEHYDVGDGQLGRSVAYVVADDQHIVRHAEVGQRFRLKTAQIGV